MRLTPSQLSAIQEIVAQLAGPGAVVRLFGSRLDDAARGGDVDLLVELETTPGNPAWLAACISAALERRLDGRRVDVLLSAPGLRRLPVHELALRHGVRL